MKEFPKKFKYGRVFRIKLKSQWNSKNFLNTWFYQYGIKALENGKIRAFHINAFIRLLKRKFKKELKVRLNIALVTPVTQKPREVRMGKVKVNEHIENVVSKKVWYCLRWRRNEYFNYKVNENFKFGKRKVTCRYKYS